MSQVYTQQSVVFNSHHILVFINDTNLKVLKYTDK